MLVVSPHLDDAALSCAVRLLAGTVDEVVTVFAGIPSSATPLSAWDQLTRTTSVDLRVKERRHEDSLAWASIGQRYSHLNHVEAPVERHDRDALIADIRRVSARHSHVLLPAGIGGHPDHLAVRDAGLAAVDSRAKILLYGELPYAAYYGWPGSDRYLDVEAYWIDALTALSSTHRVSLPQLVRLDHGQVEQKIKLLHHYSSQFRAVTGGSLELATQTDLFAYELQFEVESH